MTFDFSKIEGKKILITGGAGFVGCNLIRRLLELNAKVTVFIREGKNLENLQDILDKIEVIYGDLRNVSDVENNFKDKDFIFHLAWQTDLKKSMANPIEDVENDIIGLLNILETCKKNNPTAKIVFASATTVVGLPKKIPSNEDERENPLSVYEANKLLAEKYLQLYFKSYGLKTCTLRFSNVFGEYQRIDNPNRGILNFMIGKALGGEKLTVYGDGSFIRDYCYIQNYIDALILAAISENTNGKTYVLGSGEGRTFNEVVEKIKIIVESLTNKKVEITNVPDPNEHEINKRNFIANHSKLSEDTGWKPEISFDEGLRKTIEFYIHNLYNAKDLSAKMETKKLAKENSDYRRDIFAVKHDVDMTRREMLFYVKGKTVLGNHYHKTFMEHFLLVSGEATLLTQKIDENGKPTGEVEKRVISAPEIITMPSYTAYSFTFHGPGIMQARISKPDYDVKDINPYLVGESMELLIGQVAPDILLPDQNGKMQSLADYLGKWILLYFYPKDDTEGCTKEACSVRDNFQQFNYLGVQLIGISTDPIESHANFAKKHNLSFTLLSDAEKRVVKLYNAWGKKKSRDGIEYEGPYRNSFLISPDGKIAKIYENVNPENHITEVIKDLEKLKSP